MWTVNEGWRYMFVSEAFPELIFGILLFFVPKTPSYLVLVRQEERAFHILERIRNTNGTPPEPDCGRILHIETGKVLKTNSFGGLEKCCLIPLLS